MNASIHQSLISLEVLGVSIIENDQSEGIIKISLQDKDASTNSFFGNLFGGNSSEELNINVDLTDQGKATLITIENNSYTRVKHLPLKRFLEDCKKVEVKLVLFFYFMNLRIC